jgi:anti-sigma regulatory factor (Ser/Thr protein kinase)
LNTSDASEALSYSVWHIHKNGEASLLTENDPSEFETILGKKLSKLHMFNDYFLMSEGGFERWLGMLHSPPINFYDIAALAPSSITLDGQQFQLFYYKDLKDALFLIIQNVSALAHLNSKDNSEYELTQIITKISQYRIFFHNFIFDLKVFMIQTRVFISNFKIEDDILTETYERIHTIKGACSIFSIFSIERQCIKLEETYNKYKRGKINQSEFKDDFLRYCTDLQLNYSYFCESISNIFGINILSNKNSEAIERRDLLEFSSTIQSSSLRNKFDERFLKKTVEQCLSPFNSVIQAVASDNGKLINSIKFSKSCSYRIDPDYFYYATNGIVHIFKNAAGHGIEEPELRIEANKPDSGNIYIDLEEEENGIFLCITDDGRGIKEDLFEKIFVSGFSQEKRLNKNSGMGLGLSSLKRRVEEIGGTITVNSILNEKSTFRIFIPKSDLTDQFIEKNQSYTNQTLYNLRKLNLPTYKNEIICGRNESTIEIIIKSIGFNIRKYRDINSTIPLSVFTNPSPSRTISDKELLLFYNNPASNTIVKKINTNTKLDDIFTIFINLSRPIKGASRNLSKAKIIIDELHSNALRYSKLNGEDEISFSISINETHTRIIFLDHGGALEIQSTIKRIAQVIQEGFTESILEDNESGAGIGLSMLLAKSNLFFLYTEPNKRSCVGVEFPNQRNEKTDLKNLLLIEN